jgi:ABC-type uncharacterized transport system YnjBCD ATPase subunit
MSLGIASNYLASFQPVRPLAGFETVLSTKGADLLSQIPLENAAMELAMAKQTLAEAGQTRRQQMVIDSRQQELEAARRQNGLRMAGALFGMGGSVGSGLSVADPLALKAAVDGMARQRRADLAGRSLRSTALFSQALENLS